MLNLPPTPYGTASWQAERGKTANATKRHRLIEGNMARPALNPPLTIVLIEDSLVVRQTMGALLGELAGVKVVGGAEDEFAAIELLKRQQPGLAIVDLKLRAGSGLGVLRALSKNPEHFGRPRAVVLSNHDQPVLRQRCLTLGVERFFDKSKEIGELLAYVRLAASS